MSTSQDPQATDAARGEDAKPSPDELRADIEQTRDERGDTVEQLAAKTDVKGRARARLQEVRANAVAKKDDLTAKVKERAPSSAGNGTSGDDLSAGPESSPSVQERGQQVAGQALTTAKENPLPLAAVGGFVLGFLIGRGAAR
jgi:ElaB/YqjD/DUF883 family membrane-anchored ribosome-binding protein